MGTGADRKELLNYQLSFIPNIVSLPLMCMIRYEWEMDSASGFLVGIFFRGQNLLLCKLLLFSDQNFRRSRAKVSAFEWRNIEE